MRLGLVHGMFAQVVRFRTGAPVRAFAPFAPFALVAAGIASGVAACSASDRPMFDVVTEKDASATEPAEPSLIPDGGTTCTGLECKRPKCDDGKTTTLTGKVYDPAGKTPLYNVVVYIPGGTNGDAELPPITEGVSCERCASLALDPMTSAITNAQGEFVLDDVPVSSDVPIVVQIGKWRRRLTIDITKECAENKVADKSLRLPRNGSEGNMPQIAVAAGGLDSFECFLRGVGIDDDEFMPGAGTRGHVHVFNGSGGYFPDAPKAGGTSADPFGGELWNDLEKLKPYDMVLLACEGSEYNDNKGGNATGARQAMWDYANLGGRIFATHYHSTWFKNSPQADWSSIAAWKGTSYPPDGPYDVVMTNADGSPFPKGEALADWLVAVGASSTKGVVELSDLTSSLTELHAPAQAWLDNGVDGPRYFSFNAPVLEKPDNQCGRAVFSDVHLMEAGGSEFPEGCPEAGDLDEKQRAMEFMFFDLSSCVQADTAPPTPPR